MTDPQTPTPPAKRLEIERYFPQVADIEQAIRFYHDLLGLQSTEGDPRVRVQWFPTFPFVQELFAVKGELRNVVFRVPGMSRGPVLKEIGFNQWSGAKGKRLSPRLQDPGAARVVLRVNDIDMLTGRLTAGGATMVTPGGKPVVVADASETKRVVVFEDFNGFFVELSQPEPLPPKGQGLPSDYPPYPREPIVGYDIAITVADLDKSARFFREVIGFDVSVEPSFHADAERLDALGIEDKAATYREAVAVGPDRTPQLRLIQFDGVDQQPIAPLIADPNALMIRIINSNMDEDFAKVKAFPEATITNVSGEPAFAGRGPRRLNVRIPGSSAYVQFVEDVPMFLQS